jgi:hypothetical protein
MGLLASLIKGESKLSVEEMPEILDFLVKKAEAGTRVSICGLIAKLKETGPNHAFTVPILEVIRVQGLQAGKDADVESWWLNADQKARINILETTIVRLSSK